MDARNLKDKRKERSKKNKKKREEELVQLFFSFVSG